MGACSLDEDTAALDHVTAGTRITVIDKSGHARGLVVTGIVDVGISHDTAGGSVLILPAATLRALTGADGYQRIDVAAAPGVSQSALAARLAGLRFTRASVVTGGQLVTLLAEQNAGGEGLLSTGLLIFALVSLLVAALVIYNSFRTLLAQRLREVALLRCVGATRRQVLADILTESAVLGLAASVAGLCLGTVLAAVVNSGSVSLTPATVALSLLTGIVVTVGAALLPAAAASRTAPVAALTTAHEGTVRGRKTRIILALLLGAIGLALTAKGIPAGQDRPSHDRRGRDDILPRLPGNRAAGGRAAGGRAWLAAVAPARRADAARDHRRAAQPVTNGHHHGGADHRDRADDALLGGAVHRRPVRHPRGEPPLPRRLPAVSEAGRHPGSRW